MIYVRNVETDVYDIVPDHYLDNPVLGKNLVAAGDNVQAAPKNKITKEQPAPEAESIVAEPEIIK